jgi:hypothetical protein
LTGAVHGYSVIRVQKFAAPNAANKEMIAIGLNGVKLANYRRMRFSTASDAYQAQYFLNGLIVY